MLERFGLVAMPGGDVKLFVEYRLVRGITPREMVSQDHEIEAFDCATLTWHSIVLLGRSCGLALSDHVGHGTFVAEAMFDFAARLIIKLAELGSNVALLLQQAVQLADLTLGLFTVSTHWNAKQ